MKREDTNPAIRRIFVPKSWDVSSTYDKDVLELRDRLRVSKRLCWIAVGHEHRGADRTPVRRSGCPVLDFL